MLATANSGCAVNPVTGSQEVVLVSIEGEKEIGAETAKLIEKEMGFVDDPALLNYVQNMGKRLANYSPYQQVDYQFQIIDSAEPNAFALPGGYVYISRGLLVLTNSADELAGVIGHEIGHVAARHGVQRLTRAAPIGFVTGITSAAVGLVSPLLASAVSGTGSFINSAVLAPYSRGQENDADAIGQELAAKAGWDPAGITHFLNTLDREVTRNDSKASSIPFLSTHPSTPDRVRKTEQRATEITYSKPNPVANDHAAFLQKLDGLIFGENAKQGVVINQDFLHPTLRIGISFPQDWEIVNQSEYVAAVEKNQNATLVLQLDGEGISSDEAAKNFLNEANLGNSTIQKLTISGLPASQIKIVKQGQAIIMTWIAFQDQVYRLTAVSKQFNTNEKTALSQSIVSFHPLSKAEMSTIKQQRVRIIAARDKESLPALLKRAGSDWDEESCAIANNLQSGSALEKGQLIKVVIAESF